MLKVLSTYASCAVRGLANIQGHATAAVPEGLHKIGFSVLQGSSAD